MPTYTSASGRQQDFSTCSIDGNWNHVGGVYLMVEQRLWLSPVVLYAGQTNDFSDRMPNHEQWPVAAFFGANAIFAASLPWYERDEVERWLIAEFNPPLNVQHKPTAPAIDDLWGALLGWPRAT